MTQRTKPTPAKPTPDFPLFPHASGKWAKKINGKTRYFGAWDDPQGALAEYENANRDIVSLPTGLTIQNAGDHFLTSKAAAVERGELSQHSFADYRRTCIWMAKFWGHNRTVASLSPLDFAGYKDKLSTVRSARSLGNEITRVRVVLKWCFNQRLIAAPIHFGAEFKKPSAKTLRKNRREGGKKLFAPWQIHRLLDEAGVHFRAMILLGINCGFGNTDCAMLPIEAIDDNWLDFPRPKTEVERRIPLWPETVEALRASLSKRPQPLPPAAQRVFVRYSGLSLDGTDNIVAKRFRALLLTCGLTGGGFYWLRHTFRTVADETKDQPAINTIMGHSDPHIADAYREGIGDKRLLAITNHVRDWLFAK